MVLKAGFDKPSRVDLLSVVCPSILETFCGLLFFLLFLINCIICVITMFSTPLFG